MSPEEAGKLVHSAVAVAREDIARAKTWLVQASGSNTSGMADQWLRDQSIVETKKVDPASKDCTDVHTNVARAYSVRLAFYQAVWEHISAGELIPAGSPTNWAAGLGFDDSRYAFGIPLQLGCAYPERIQRLPLASPVTTDSDIFLIRNVHGIAKVAELDGEEIGFLLGEIAKLKRID